MLFRFVERDQVTLFGSSRRRYSLNYFLVVVSERSSSRSLAHAASLYRILLID